MWKPLVYQGISYEDKFEVSDEAQIRNIKTRTIYKLNVSGNGYLAVCVSLGNRKDKLLIKIHKAIAETFILNPNNLPVINHKDGNKLNNNISNLEWITSSDNTFHAYDTGLKISIKGMDHYGSKLTNEDIIYIKEKYVPRDKQYGCRALAKQFNIDHSIISGIINNKGWNHLNMDI